MSSNGISMLTLLSLHSCKLLSAPFALPRLPRRYSTQKQGNNLFKVVECSPICRSNHLTPLGSCRAKRSTLMYRFNGSSEFRDNYLEQFHQFYFEHPYSTVWNIHSAAFVDSYNYSNYSHIAIEISLND